MTQVSCTYGTKNGSFFLNRLYHQASTPDMHFVLVHHILTAFSFFVNIMLLYPQIRLILPPMRD